MEIKHEAHFFNNLRTLAISYEIYIVENIKFKRQFMHEDVLHSQQDYIDNVA